MFRRTRRLAACIAALAFIGFGASSAHAQNSLNFTLYDSFTHGGDGTPFSDPICGGTISFAGHQPAHSDTYTWAPWSSWASLCPEMAAHGNNHFGARFWGEIYAPFSDWWYMDLMSDDGSSVKVNGTTVMSLFGDHADASTYTYVSLGAGWHSYEVNYYEWEGGANLYMAWDERMSMRAGTETVVPEPASVLLLGTGLLVVGGIARHRRRRTS